MAVDHAQRARWASRVLRLRQGGLNLGIDDVVSTAGAVEQRDPTMTKLEESLDVDDIDAHVIGAAGHPLSGLIRSFNDIDDDNYVTKLFDMSIDELLEQWTNETATAHEQMVSHVDQLRPGTIAMSHTDVDDCYSSQDQDEQTYQDQMEDMSETGAWPGYHRLGHGVAMQREAND